MAFWYLFDFIIKEVNNLIIALKYLLLEAIGKKFNKEKTQFNCFDESYIWSFGNIWHQDYSKT